MDERDRTEDSPPGRTEPEQSPFDRFQSLTKRLLHVSKDDVREAEAREREKRRTA